MQKNLAVLILLALGFLFVFPSPPLFAETVFYESPLVWRIDGLGDYLLAKIASNSTYVHSPAIATKGLIKSITAAWKFEGEVDFEVSADDGLHFSPVTNGVPLAGGFVQGTSLKWRAHLGSESSLDEVMITYTDTSGVMGGFGNPELSGFKYRESFQVIGSSAGPLYNYQIEIKVGESEDARDADIHCQGHVDADFRDLRFTLSDGETLLPYYIERISGEKPNRVAEIFLKIAQIPSGGITLYMYYGNPDALSLSDAKATFDFYEDFAGNALDAEKWHTYLNPGGSASVSTEGLLLDAAGVTSKLFEFKGGIIEYSATAETGYEVRFVIRDPDPNSETDINQVVYSSSYNGAQHCIAVGDIVRANEAKRIAALTPYGYRVIVHGDNITFERHSADFGKKQASVSYKDAQGPSRGYIGLKTAGLGRGKSVTKFHWLRVRKYVQSPPYLAKSLVGNEERVLPPVFTNIILAFNGDLILADGYTEGAYITKELISPYTIRIFVPRWKGENASIDISADGGRNFRTNCTNDTYYYASRGDFVKGNSIKCRLTLRERVESIGIQYALGNIVVLAPNGDEVLSLGSQKEIIWSAWDYERTYPIKLEYSLDGGRTFAKIADNIENSGAYIWNIPDDSSFMTKQALLRASDSYDSSMSDVSDRAFSIVAAGEPTIDILKVRPQTEVEPKPMLAVPQQGAL